MTQLPSESAVLKASPAHVPPRHPLLQKIEDGAMALSLSNLLFVGAWYIPVMFASEFIYFKKVPLTRTKVLALAVVMLSFAGMVWTLTQAMRRSRKRWFRPLCEWLFLLVSLLALDSCRQVVFSTPIAQIVSFFKQPLGFLLLMMMLTGVLWKRRWVVQAAAVVVGILSPLAVLTLARIAVAILHPQQVSEAVPPPMGPMREGQPRVVWMIFDETDQRLAFEQRPRGVQMPEFDRFRCECLSATNAYPPGNNTKESMPGLITGLRISKADPKNASELELTLADSGKVVGWTELPSVFDGARELGVNTALVGWFHPYSRILGRSLNYCAWYPYMLYQPVSAQTFGEALRNELECAAWNLHLRHTYVNTCRATLANSLAVATNANYGFMLLHLPPPHLPGVFDPATGGYTVLDMQKVRGYFRNLALADLFLGTLRRGMETSGLWDKECVIISADHSWRASATYDRRRDSRIPFLVKAPGMNRPIVYSPEMNTLVTHDLVLAILREELASQQQLVPWLDAQPAVRVPPPAGSDEE